MNAFDRLYENLLVNPDDHLSLNQLWSLLIAADPDTRRVAEETLSDYLSFRHDPKSPVQLIALAG